ncbi:MAG: glycosyltransferase [Candidatus Kapabacteria bacterium]|nr:glycosyltransferase [Candidatus Kapabacteria bacterium]
MAIKPLSILFLTCRFPFPLVGGDRIKPYHLLKHLAQHHDVTLVCVYQGIDRHLEEYVRHLTTLGVKVIPIRLSLLTSLTTILFSFLGSKPLEVLYYLQPTMKKTVDILMKTQHFDLAIAFFMRTAEYIRNKEIPKVLIAEDCRYEYQYRSASASRNFLQKLIRSWEYRKLLNYEQNVMNNFDCNTFVTNEDISFVSSVNPQAKYALLSNGFDQNRFTYTPYSSDRKNGLFVGKLDVWANEMMVRNIVDVIIPKVRKQFPDFALSIVGGNPSKQLQRYLQKIPFVTLYANVEDVVPFLHSHLVFIHPHAGATGIQNKIIEAMATGIPIVTTVSGVQGISAIDSKHVLIAEAVDTMHYSVCRLLESPTLAQTLSTEARTLIESNHTWDSIYASFDSIIASVIE